MIAPFSAIEKLPRWLAWREERRGTDKALPTKVPYAALDKGNYGSSTDPATWGVRGEAEARQASLPNGTMTGVGVALGDLGTGLHLAGLDLDASIGHAGMPFMITNDTREQLLALGYAPDNIASLTPQQAEAIVAPNGRLSPWAADIISLLQTYAEISPSGSGLKAFFYLQTAHVRPFLDLLGVEKDAWGCKRGIPGLDGAAHGPGIEIYCSARYFTVTERIWSLDHPDIEPIGWARLVKLAKLIPPPAEWPAIGKGKDATAPRPSSGKDTSRSGRAARIAIALQPDSYEEMVEGLRNHPDADVRAWVEDKGEAGNGRELKRIWARIVERRTKARQDGLADLEARAGGDAPLEPPLAAVLPEGVRLEDFYGYMVQHNYIFAAARDTWPAGSVNARIPPVQVGVDNDGKPIRIKASTWIDQNRPVEQMTWAPGMPMIVENRLIAEGGWIERRGVSCFNLYRPPLLKLGNPDKAGRWIAHVERIYPDDHEHIIRWLAHRVQRPQDKINHALLLGGLQGIGKDSLIEPVKRAVGPWNVAEPSSQQLVGQFNGFAKSVILRISEAHDLGDIDRYQFYEHLKVYTAAPPDVLRVNEKNLREHNVSNCCGVIITTNHKTDGIYLPADDRRHYVAWSYLVKEDFEADYWADLWGYYDSGGDRHVSAYLAALDLAGFNPKAPPPKTPAFWDIVNASRAPEDAELADALDLLNNPDAITVARVVTTATDDFAAWLKDRNHRRNIPHRFEACGYTPVRNPDAGDGLWKIGSRRMVIYGKAALTFHEQLAAVRALVSHRPAGQ